MESRHRSSGRRVVPKATLGQDATARLGLEKAESHPVGCAVGRIAKSQLRRHAKFFQAWEIANFSP